MVTELTKQLGATPFVVTVAGVGLPLDAVGPVTIRHGRNGPDDQPEASTCSFVFEADALPLPKIGQPVTVNLGASARTPLGLGPAFDGVNLLGNPGYESALTGTNNFGSPTLALVTPGRTGSGQALQVTTTATGTQGLIQYATAGVSVPAGYQVKCGAWFKTDAGVAVTITGRAISVDGVNFLAGGLGQVTVTATGAWQYVETTPWSYTPDACRPGLALTVTGTTGRVLLADDVSTVAQTDAAWSRTVPRFVGTISDLDAAPGAAGVYGPGYISVTATSAASRLGRTVIGDTPWPAETDGTRAARILASAIAASAGITAGPVDLGTVDVLGRDVDRQPALGLLTELASQCGGVVASTRAGTVEYHDANHRRNVPALVTLTAANVLANAKWSQDLQGLVNDLTLAYGPELTGGQATVRLVDTVSVATYGPLAASVSTQLTNLAGATARATDMVGRRSRPRWRLDTATVDMLRSLDRTSAGQLAGLEVGALLGITGFPSSGPFVTARLYVEGWTEVITAAGWRMELAVSDFGLTGPSPRWVDVPAGTRWSDVPSDVAWLTATGWYPGEVPGGRWVDLPSGDQWNEISPARTWATG